MFANGEGLSDARIRELYDANFPLLYRIAFRIAGTAEAAEDIVQETFIKLVEKRPPFPTADDAKFWLIRVVKNNALNHAKRKTREVRAYERFFREARKESESAEDNVVRDATKADMQRYLSLLPENLRVVLVLKEYGLMNYKEIGATLGITEGNVKVRVFRAREALAELMRKEHDDVS